MNKNLFSSLLLTAVFVLGTNSAFAENTPEDTQQYCESYAADAANDEERANMIMECQKELKDTEDQQPEEVDEAVRFCDKVVQEKEAELEKNPSSPKVDLDALFDQCLEKQNSK